MLINEGMISTINESKENAISNNTALMLERLSHGLSSTSNTYPHRSNERKYPPPKTVEKYIIAPKSPTEVPSFVLYINPFSLMIFLFRIVRKTKHLLLLQSRNLDKYLHLASFLLFLQFQLPFLHQTPA